MEDKKREEVFNDVLDRLPAMRLMFIEAYSKNMIFYNSYASIYFTPKELKEEMIAGSFRWGIVNWELISKEYYIGKLNMFIQSNNDKINKMETRIKEIQNENK